MRETRYLIGRVFLMLGALMLTGIGTDELLLKSDVRSLFVFLGALAGIAAVAALVTGTGVSLGLRLVGRSCWVTRLGTVAPMTLGLSGMVAILCQPVFRKLDVSWALPWVWVGAGVICYLVIRRKPDPGIGMSRIGFGLLVLSLIGAPAALGWNASLRTDWPEEFETPPGKTGLLVIVVDALGADCVSALNEDSPVQTPNIDRLLARSTVFPNAHTSASHTFGAFRTLYTGQVLKREGGPTPSLLRELQEAGVNVRIVASHVNALPDNKKIRYRGLRSMLLTQNYTWIPNWMDLDYHVMSYLHAARRRTKKGIKTERLKLTRDLLNSSRPITDPFDVALIEIGKLTRDERPFLIVLHLFFNDTRRSLPKPQTFDLYPERTEEERAVTNEAIRKRSNRYTDEEAWWADEYRASYLDEVGDFDEGFGRFLAALSGSVDPGALDLVFLSDHGSSSEQNELWYAYHWSEAVTRIPLAILQAGVPATRDLRPSSTADVSATIGDWFGVGRPGEGHSLLGEEFGGSALSFTMRDHEGIARATSYSSTRKDVLEIDAEGQVTWVSSYEVGEDGVVTDRPVVPADPERIASAVQDYCATHDCP